MDSFEQATLEKPELANAADRTPPHSDDAEKGILGCILISPQECLNRCTTKLRGSNDAFYDLRHQTIYSVAQEMHDNSEVVDIITLSQKLGDAGKLNEVGGLAYLSSLADGVPSASNLDYYLEIVCEKHKLRRLLEVATSIAAKAYECGSGVTELLDEAEMRVLSIRQHEVKEASEIKEVVTRSIDKIEQWFNAKGSVLGLETGLDTLDRATMGLHRAEIVVLAAFPSTGKTALAGNIVEHVALNMNKPVGVFSLEMSSELLTIRMMASQSRTNMRDLQMGDVSERDFKKITAAAGAIAKSNIHIDDASDLSISELRARARRMKQEHGIELLVVDYLQLLTAKSSEGRQMEVAEISRGLKAMAKELDVPVIALSQLNDDGKLRESRAIGQDADCVWVLSRENEENESPDSAEISLTIRKQRNGPAPMVVKLVFLKKYTRFECASPIEANYE